MREEVALSLLAEGQMHFGLYAIESEMVTAWIPSVGSRTCWLDGRDPTKVAKLLLQEVVRECRRKHAVAASRPSRRLSDSVNHDDAPPGRRKSFTESGLR
jgi:hypothetical protein